MLRTHATRLLALAAFANVSATNTVHAEDWRLIRSHLLCIEENIESYLATPNDPITIVLPACPIVDFQEALEQLAEASLVTRDLTTSQPAPRTIISISRRELNCLLQKAAAKELEVIEVDPERLCGE